jgi:hypothetical protein
VRADTDAEGHFACPCGRTKFVRAVRPLLVFESGVAVSFDKRPLASESGGGASGVGGATRAAVRANEERGHHADHDPQEEHRAGRPRGVMAEHGEIFGRRVVRPSFAQRADARDEAGDQEDSKSDDDKHSTPLICS